MPLGKYQTSINSPGLIYGGVSKAQWQSYYDKNVTAYPGIQDCPASTPYYDSINCISCIDGFYFNLETRFCMKCPKDTKYDGTTNPNWVGCVAENNSQVKITPDIAKMYANIFW